MPDVYATIDQQPGDVVAAIASALELRAAAPEQRAMLERYLRDIDFPDAARVVDIGCGTGVVTEVLAQWPNVREAVGIDPSPVMIAKSRVQRGSIPNVAFREGDGRSLPLGGEEFDVAIMHTVLSHVPQPERALAEAFRVLRPGGWLGVFDGDYETITVSIASHDPLGACIESFKESFINDIWLMRKLPTLVSSAGFRLVRFDSHGYIEAAEPTYLLSVVDRGADALVKAGVIDRTLAEALKAEARRRSERGEFFGHIGYASLIARKPEGGRHAD